MKKPATFSISGLLSFILMLSAFGSYAAKKTDSSSVYEVTVPKHTPSLYDGPLPYIIFGVFIVAIIVLGYIYWRNGMRND